MASMAERIAREWCKADGFDPDDAIAQQALQWKICTAKTRAALDAIRAAGFVVVSHELTDKACDAALSATGSWLDIPGSALTVNREKMRRRWRRCLVEFKREMEAD